MNKPTIRLNSPEIEDMLARIEKLEEFERESRTSDMLLFWAEVSDMNFIIAAPNVETAIMLVRQRAHNNNVEFLGRASLQYDKPQIIKWWNSYNWDATRDDLMKDS